jgi:hypothetical protein
MAPLLADWDARPTSEAERALLGPSRSACVTSSTGRANAPNEPVIPGNQRQPDDV